MGRREREDRLQTKARRSLFPWKGEVGRFSTLFKWVRLIESDDPLTSQCLPVHDERLFQFTRRGRQSLAGKARV
jgi:hypothetical protein